MRRYLAVLVIPAILVFGACASDSDDAGSLEIDPDTDTYTVSGDDADEGSSPEDLPDGDTFGTAGGLLASLNPLQMLSGLNPSPSSADADPALEAALLTLSDLPEDYMSIGEFSYSLPTELGDLEMAATIFAQGDILGGEFTPTVMSAAIALTPELAAELEAEGGIEELTDFSQADLQEALGSGEALGFGLEDLRVLDGASLGDGGAGLHMTMDFGELFSALGPPDEEIPFDAIAMDMYIFVDGDQMLMLVSMWPGDGGSPVDAYDLAATMDSRAG